MQRSAIAIVMALTMTAALGRGSVHGASLPATQTCKASEGYAEAFGGRRTFLLRADSLEAVKLRGLDSPQVEPARKALLARAEAALVGPDYSVVDKQKLPPSKDKHDYMSIGPYWWPDAKQPGGEPYVRSDGKVNPERDSNAFDTTALESMSASVEALTLAYYFSGDLRYAHRAARLLRVWFLQPATRMNPNAAFAQGIPGRVAGRAEGVLDTFRLLRVVEGIGLLAPSGTLTKREQAGLENWFAEYVSWMLASPTGKEEGAAENNHGLWYDLQLTQFALFARRVDVARSAIERTQQRIAQQIEPDGKMPRELQRTRALHYSVFALQAAAGIADLAGCVGKDVWNTKTGDGRGLRVAIDFLLPYVGRESEFPYPDLKPTASESAFELLSRAARAYADSKYANAAAVLGRFNPDSEIHLTMASPNAAEPAPIDAAVRLADWQLARMGDAVPIARKTQETGKVRGWEQAVFWIGMTALADAGGPQRIGQAILAMGNTNRWLPGDKPYFADDHAITQSYLWAARNGAGEAARVPTRRTFDRVVGEPAVTTLAFDVPAQGYGATECLKRWCWCDALFMAPPAFVELSRQTSDDRYRAFAMKEFQATTDFLYDPVEHLYYRDSRFFERRDAEGRKLFWSRGNGWVFAGIARIVPNLDKGGDDRRRMEALFVQMAERLRGLQKPDGYWPPSLLAPENSPPEVSGTAFYTYGMAWGISAGLLPRDVYEPIVRKGWAALVRAIQPDGRLGWVQQVSDRPETVEANDTQFYGVGAFLLAATAVAELDKPGH